MRPFKPNYNLITAVSAVLISGCAFIISFQQTEILQKQAQIMEEEKHASVWPRVFVSTTTGVGEFALNIRNQGIGPAQIEHVEVFVNGQLTKRWPQVFSSLLDVKGQSFEFSKNTLNKLMLSTDHAAPVFTISNPNQADMIRGKWWSGVEVVIYYSSIYGKKWKLHVNEPGKSGFAVPVEINDIPVNEQRAFLD